MRVLIVGNSGSGKTTMARALAAEFALEHLDLDTVVWEPHRVAVARPDKVVREDLARFVAGTPRWVIEGSYARWIEHLAPSATELRFLNPGVERCLANHASRPWEPHKYDHAEDQEERRAALAAWVRSYEQRDDDFGLGAHRDLFDRFAGPKREYVEADLPLHTTESGGVP